MELTETLALFINFYLIKQFTFILDMIDGIKTSHHGLDIVGYRRATYS
jgi:hypothetical protein